MAKEISYYTKSAVKINGTYIEELIEGYSTLSSEGRDTIDRQIELYESKKTDGETVEYTRYLSRTITVAFLIEGGNLHSKMEQLMTILSAKEAEFIFNDEADKFYKGVAIPPEEMEHGIGWMKGEYQIVCADPFKYNVAEFGPVILKPMYDVDSLEEFSLAKTYYAGDMCKRKSGVEYVAYVCNTDGTIGAWDASKWDTAARAAFTVNYHGSYKTFPRFEVDFATDESSTGEVDYDADCGFVQFAKAVGDDYKRIQFGDDEEVQWRPTGGFNVSFLKNTLGSFTNSSSGTYHGWVDDATAAASDKGIVPRYGSNNTTYHGARITRNAAAARDFTFSWSQLTYLLDDKQTFGFMALCLDSNNNIVTGVKMYKGNTTSKKGTIAFYKDGEIAMTRGCDFDYHGMFGYDYGTTKNISKKTASSTSGKPRAAVNTIKRKDNVISIKLADKTSPVMLYPDQETPIAKVCFSLAKYKNKANPAENNIRWCSFEGSSESNTFASGDVLEVDCGSADVLLNGVQDLSLGDVGNQWDDLYLDVGENVIYAAYSEWCQLPPTFKLYYRERWL